MGLRKNHYGCLAVWLVASLSACGSKGGSTSKQGGFAPVAAYLMPPGVKRVEIRMERRKFGPAQRIVRQPRLVVAHRTGDGVLYQIRERVEGNRWRTAARLFFAARSGGAFIRRQLDLHGRPVGPRTLRLVFPWPLERRKQQFRRNYAIFGRRSDGGRRVRATVRILRTGFATRVGKKRFSPCLEVEEILLPDVGGRMELRSVFCRGAGRVRIEQKSESLSHGKNTVIDQAIQIRIPK